MDFRNLDTAVLTAQLHAGVAIANDNLSRYKRSRDHNYLRTFQESSRQVLDMRAELENRGIRIEAGSLGLDNPGSGAGRENTRGGQEGVVLDRSDSHREERQALYGLLTDPASARRDDFYGSVLKRASLSTGTGPVGGYLVPTFVQTAIIQDQQKFDSVRAAGAQIMPVIGRENIPVINDPSAAYQSESSAISGMTAADPTFGNVEVRPSLLNAFTHYSWHVQTFSPADVEAEIIRSFGRSLARKAAEKFLIGTGSDQPQGLLEGAGTGVTTASATAFTAAEVTTLWNSLDPEFQQDAVFIMSPSAATLLRTLESDNGMPLWVQSLMFGNQQLFGRPVLIDANMEGLTANKRPIVVASMREAYVIAESQVFLIVDPYTRATNAENRVIAYQFSDGRVKRATAAKKMVMDDGL